MPKFCTQCGAQVADGARFCQACGVPVQGSKVNDAAGPKMRRRGLWLTVLAGILLGFAGLMAWLLVGEGGGPSRAELDAAASQWLHEHATALVQDACLDDLDYAADAIVVDDADRSAKRWMDVLAGAGVYMGPQPLRHGPSAQWRYVHGPHAARFIRHGQLCVAGGLVVRRIQTVPRREIDVVEGLPPGVQWPEHWALARLTLEWSGLASWATQPYVHERLPQLDGDLHQNIILLQRGKQWVLPSPMEQVGIMLQLAALKAGAVVGQAAQDFSKQFGHAQEGAGSGEKQVQSLSSLMQAWLDDLRRFLGFGDPAEASPAGF